MQQLPARKTLHRLGLLYGIIVTVINFIGFLIPYKLNMPMNQSSDFFVWVAFMDSHEAVINLLSYLQFILPISACVLYVLVVKEEQIVRRIINLPLVYALIGASGWFLSYVFQLICLFVCKSKTGISILGINLTSLVNIVQICMFIFIAAFLVMDAINRKSVLPKHFPDGNISSFPGTIKLSIKILFIIFYLAVSIFPIFFLTSSFYYKSVEYQFNLDVSVYIVILFMIGLGLVILFSFANYFSSPLKKLKKATEQIKNADYNTVLDVVSNDDFGELSDNFNDMARSLDEKTKKLIAVQNSVLTGMATMVESRDNSTGGHIKRTSDCVRIFVTELVKQPEYSFLTDAFCESVIKAAPMHDLGKIAVPDAILQKPGKFTDEEYEKMKSHSAEGARIVEQVLNEVDDLAFKQIAINVAHFHHEKWNGQGYPEKIAGEQIPLEARIMALADVFDALVSKRCYKDSFSYDEAFQIIEESLGTHFEPSLGKAFIACRPQLEALYNSYT